MSIVNDLETRKARNLLKSTYRVCGSWQAVAVKLQLPNKAHAWKIAEGRMNVSDEMRAALKRNGKRAFRGFIKRVAVPFLARRQRSPRRVYGRGGVPL